MNIKRFSDFFEKRMDVKSDGGGAEKNDSGVTGQSTTSTPWKFDAVGRRTSASPGSTVYLKRFAFIRIPPIPILSATLAL